MTTLRLTVVGLVPALALAISSMAAAQTVWRCPGNNFSAQPCSDGRQLTAPAAPSTEERQQGRDVAERERRLAHTLAQQRLDREQQLRLAMGSGLTGFAHPAPAAMGELKPTAAQQPTQLKKSAKKPPARAARQEKAPQKQPAGRGVTGAASR